MADNDDDVRSDKELVVDTAAQLDVRPMELGDVDAVIDVVVAADEDADRREGREHRPMSDERRAGFRKGMVRFVEEDPDGAFVALSGDTVIGMAEAIRRGDFWGLAMLHVHPETQSRGVGRMLLGEALRYADGARVRMIMSSSDPRAFRRYSGAGLAMHPTVEATGTIDRSAIPSPLPGREGTESDLELVETADAALGRSRAADVAFVLSVGCQMEVIDSGPGRAYAVRRGNELVMLGATDEESAARALWRAIAAADGTFEAWCLTAAQDWAIRVALAARLKIVPGGALFIDGLDQPPRPWRASGWYF